MQINPEEIKRRIQQKRALSQATEEHIAALVKLIESLKALVFGGRTNLLRAHFRRWLEVQIPLHEAELTILRLQQAWHEEIHKALRQLLEIGKQESDLPVSTW